MAVRLLVGFCSVLVSLGDLSEQVDPLRCSRVVRCVDKLELASNAD
jgi:hypothetical protein